MSGEANAVVIFGLSIDKDIALLILGAIIGFGASLGTNWINNRTQRKKEEKERAINIIADVAKFVMKANERIDDIIVKLGFFEIGRLYSSSSTLDATKLEKEIKAYIENLWFESTDFSDARIFHSFQLERLSNQDILKNFEELMRAYDVFSSGVYDETILKVDSEQELKYRRLYANFIHQCIEISKIDVPIRIHQEKRTKRKKLNPS